MANDQLTATSGSGVQTTTQSPQTGSQPAGGTKSSGIQPGTSTSLLTSKGQGVPLSAAPLSTVSLSNPGPALPLTTGTAAVAQPKHHVNTVLLGFSGLLVIIALVLFWTVGRSVKSTTEY